MDETIDEVGNKLTPEQAQLVIAELFKMRDSNDKRKFFICNTAFNKEFKKNILQEEAQGYKITLDGIAGFTYIVSPYIKEKDKPVCYVTQLDLNKICGVNSTYEGSVIYVEDLLYNNIKQEWLPSEETNPTQSEETQPETNEVE